MWLASKHLGRWEEVRGDVERWDTSALSLSYRLARLALLEQNDEFFRVADAISGDALPGNAWAEWPVFEWVRKDPRFVEFGAKFCATTGEHAESGSGGCEG